MNTDDVDLRQIAKELEDAMRGNVGWGIPKEQLEFGTVWNAKFPKFSDKRRYGMVVVAPPSEDFVNFRMITTERPSGNPKRWLLLNRQSMPETCWLLLTVGRDLKRADLARVWRYLKRLPEPFLTEVRQRLGLS